MQTICPIKNRMSKLHFVGIGGSGMSGIAEVLHTSGFEITGSDLCPNDATDRLSKLSIKITYEHEASNVQECDALVISSAITEDNIEVVAAKQRKIPIIHRAEMLAELMRFKYGIAVAGTHGKTTTTSLIATILHAVGLDPTFVIGGKLNHLATNAQLGRGQFFIAEADESDQSFLHLKPLLVVVTNIDDDHLRNYHNDFASLKRAFLTFIHNTPFYGSAVVCIDDPVIRQLLGEIKRSVITYGFSEDADIRALGCTQHEGQIKFIAEVGSLNTAFPITLSIPGRHNVLNALAAIGIGLTLNLDVETMSQALTHFKGIDRRLQRLGTIFLGTHKVMLIDDYGHHPTEIAAVILAARSGWPKNRIVMVFQPHRYTRTMDLMDKFAEVLAKVDELVLLDLYSAGEPPISGCSIHALASKIKNINPNLAIHFADSEIRSLTESLPKIVKSGDLLLMQGAGDVGKLTQQLLLAASRPTVDIC